MSVSPEIAQNDPIRTVYVVKPHRCSLVGCTELHFVVRGPSLWVNTPNATDQYFGTVHGEKMVFEAYMVEPAGSHTSTVSYEVYEMSDSHDMPVESGSAANVADVMVKWESSVSDAGDRIVAIGAGYAGYAENVRIYPVDVEVSVECVWDEESGSRVIATPAHIVRFEVVVTS